MSDHLLTIELDPEGDQVFIHGDAAGLRYLGEAFLRLADKARNGEQPHDHFMTEEWGGYELSSEAQAEDWTLINHLKVYGWPVTESAKSDAET